MSPLNFEFIHCLVFMHLQSSSHELGSLQSQLASVTEALSAAQAEKQSLEKSLAAREADLRRLGEELRQVRRVSTAAC
jgi:septal ring factor EnvC (AmiA/AmiB activator)